MKDEVILLFAWQLVTLPITWISGWPVGYPERCEFFISFCVLLQALLKAVVVFSWARHLTSLGQIIVSSSLAWMINPFGVSSRKQVNPLWDLNFCCWEFCSRNLIWYQILWCSHSNCLYCVKETWFLMLYAFFVNSFSVQKFYNVVNVNVSAHSVCKMNSKTSLI